MYSCVQYYSKVNTHIYQSTHVGIKIAFTFYWPLTLFWVVWRRKATGLCSLLNHTSHRSYNVIPAPGEPGPTEPLKILKWSFPPSTLLEITGFIYWKSLVVLSSLSDRDVVYDSLSLSIFVVFTSIYTKWDDKLIEVDVVGPCPATSWFQRLGFLLLPMHLQWPWPVA